MPQRASAAVVERPGCSGGDAIALGVLENLGAGAGLADAGDLDEGRPRDVVRVLRRLER